LEASVEPVEGENVLRGRVKSSFFLGNVADLYIDVGGLELRSQVSPPQLLEPGRDVWVRVAPASRTASRSCEN
jgi:iron(III) transport system ATP-binding protein/putative spermidine/putrescine transport system ATP-binding protein